VTNDTDSFVQEVDESLRQDRFMDLIKKWGPWLLGAFVLIIAGVAGWQVWKDQSLNAARAHSDEFVAAQELARQGNFTEAKTAFEGLSDEGPNQFRLMSRLEHAAILQIEGDLQGALAEFDAVADDANDPIMRDSARMRAAYIAADLEDFPTLRTRLEPLIASESRFSFLARELLAIEAWEAGDLDLARSELENLTLAFDAPQTLIQRAQIALSVIGPAPATSADGATAPAPSEGETK
jgi:hypothetical protein